MKMTIWILFLAVISSLAPTVNEMPTHPLPTTETLEIDLEYDHSINDHVHSKFYFVEDVWVLKNGQLRHNSLSHSGSRADTMTLNPSALDSIAQYVKAHCLHGNVTKDLYPIEEDKYGRSERIRGSVRYGNQRAVYGLRTNSPVLFQNDADVLSLRKLRELLEAASENPSK